MGDINKRTLSCKYESLDYDLIENVIYLEHQHKSKLRNFITRDLQRWIAIFLIGFVAALSGFFAGFAVRFFTTVKFSQVIKLADDQCSQYNVNATYSQIIKCMILPYLSWLAWNSIPCLFGSLLVTYIAPVAAGSGIPVVKCYLNGVRIPEVVRFKTYAVKLLGVVSSVVGGLAVGKEGPFIHCGAAIGAGLSQGTSTTFKFDTKLFKSFRNDRDKRDFVSAGASAGVAAAFGAPIGGVLFALEEAASFWNQSLTWRIFFCSMMTSFTLNLFMSAYNNNAGILAFYSLVNFGLVEELDYFWFEIPVYICIAIAGGIIGASFCYFNLIITKFRRVYVTSNVSKVLEVVFIAALTATIGLTLIMFAPDCRQLPANHHHLQTRNDSIINHVLFRKRLWLRNSEEIHQEPSYRSTDEIRKAIEGHVIKSVCQPGHYSAMSSLWLKTSEGVSSTFMVLQDDIWSIRSLSIFFFVYYILAIITYGISVSSGVFIPSLLIGATGGRLIGLILQHYLGPLEWLAQPNKFAIIGAASVLGGVVRMTISLTVIIIEATGCISFGLPIMICLMISKWVADSFIEGLYDIAIHLANVPFLEWEPPLKSYSIYASDVMAPNVQVLRTTETVASLIDILKTTSHNGFPVVDLDLDYYDSRAKALEIQTAQRFANQSTSSGDFQTPVGSPPEVKRTLRRQASASSTQHLVSASLDGSYCESLIGSFQRCTVTAKRESYGRFRGIILRWQLLVMLQLKIFNENERSYESLCLKAFQKSYPRYPSLEEVIANLDEEAYGYHVDLRSIMNPNPYTVLHSASFPRIYRLFRSLGLRHLIVTDDRNQVVGMITRKDLARYVRERDSEGIFRFHELSYSS